MGIISKIRLNQTMNFHIHDTNRSSLCFSIIFITLFASQRRGQVEILKLLEIQIMNGTSFFPLAPLSLLCDIVPSTVLTTYVHLRAPFIYIIKPDVVNTRIDVIVVSVWLPSLNNISVFLPLCSARIHNNIRVDRATMVFITVNIVAGQLCPPRSAWKWREQHYHTFL